MKIAVLTKGYSHHKYFISQLSNSFEVELIVKEKKSISFTVTISSHFSLKIASPTTSSGVC